MKNGIDITKFQMVMTDIGKTILKQEGLIKKLGGGEDFAGNVKLLREKSKETTFKLLIMGIFNSGKSSFINVMLGEKLLPTKALPATALITEIYYGEKKKVIIQPHPGKWQGGNAPFEIAPGDMAKYCLINNTESRIDGNKVDSPFAKMIIYWPLPLLKEGIVIVDSPGLDDPYSHDTIVEEYLPKADAIIYCVNGAVPYSARDRKALEALNAFGFKTPIIVTTRFDNIRNDATSAELQEYIKVNNSNYLTHTSLGEKGCHYVDSLEGLKGKQSEKHSMLVNSGYFELENFLGTYLTENKGRDQISALTKGVANLNKKAVSRAKMNLAAADEPMKEFENRLADANKKIDDARRQGDLLVREFKMAIKDIEISTKPMVEEMVNSLAGQIDMDDYEPSVAFQLLHPRDSATAITEECCDEIKRQNETYIAKWSNETLMPQLSEKVATVAKRMEGSFTRFAEDLRNVEILLTNNTDEPIPVPTGPGTGSRVASFAYALFTGDIVTGLIGGAFGVGALGRTVAYQVLAGIILGIVGMFTPIGLPALIIAVILANIAALVTQQAVAATQIKKQVTNKYKEHFNKQETKRELTEKVHAEISKQISQLADNLQTAIDGDIVEKENDIRNIHEEKQKTQGDVNAKKSEWTELIARLEDIDSEIETVRRGFHIA